MSDLEGNIGGELEERELDLEMIRDDLSMVLEAINQYQEHIESLDNAEARRVLEQIRDIEKENAARLLKLILKLDPIQADKFKKEGL